MSNKVNTKLAQKRASRKIKSKEKRRIVNKNQQVALARSNLAIAKTDFKGEMDVLSKALTRNGLKNPAVAIRAGLGNGKDMQSPKVIIETMAERIKDVFKLFCTVSMGKVLVDQKAFEYKFKVDLDETALAMRDIDTRYQRLSTLAQVDMESFMVEALEIGSELETRATDLFEDIGGLEPFGKIIDAALHNSAKQLEESEKIGLPEAYNRVVESIGYSVIASAIEKVETVHKEDLA